MILYEREYFQKFKFTTAQISRYIESSVRDLDIARKDQFEEVQFTYCYQALIKIGIAVMAKNGGVKVRSVMGHHIKILEKLSEILGDPDVFTIGNAMRMKRNKDLYDASCVVTKKEADDYIVFVNQVIQKSKRIICSL
ncbi:MAG: hypothetical protein HQL26_06070 [Candidatus Omnitrophica bacterium]|nr:hypothetical protein [Candidatus Omnitrophota bacterium]